MKKLLYTLSFALFLSAGTYAQQKYQRDSKIANFADLQTQPIFPGGPGAFQQEVLTRFNATDNGAPSGTRSRVYVSFIVEIDGSLSDITVQRDPGYGFGEEVVQAIKGIDKKWSPGIIANQPVRVSYTLPVTIQVP